MALVALIKRGGTNVPALIDRIKKGDEFCFVGDQKMLAWHVARVNGRANALDYRGEIELAGGIVPSIIPRKRHTFSAWEGA